MATIGSAVLQIIPSLRGVSEAIEKEVAGKSVTVAVSPKVDQRATERVAKQTRDTVEKQTKQVTVEPKVDQAAAQKAGKQAGKTVSDEMATTVKSSAGKEAAKALIDGLADGVKREMPRGGVAEVFVDGLADGIKQGIDGVGIGGQVVTTISDGVKSGNLGGTIRDAVVPANRRLTPDPARHLQVFDEFAVVGEVEFFHRIVLLGGDGTGRAASQLGNFGHGIAFHQKMQHLPLPGGKHRTRARAGAHHSLQIR